MHARNTRTSWGWVARAIHWVMAALILFMLGLGVYMANFVPDLLKQFGLFQLHKSWGFIVFVLALVRVGWRAFDPVTPAEPPGMPRWQRTAAKATHAMLYALILIMPLSGWAMSSASPTQDLLNIRNMVFGAFALPDPWVPGVASVADLAAKVHTFSAILMAVILVLHIGAALRHRFIDHDDVLARMTIGK